MSNNTTVAGSTVLGGSVTGGWKRGYSAYEIALQEYGASIGSKK